jgi:hypothetical protein
VAAEATEAMSAKGGRHLWLTLLASTVLVTHAACTTTAAFRGNAWAGSDPGTPGSFSYDNTVSAGCRQNPANCAALSGKEAALEPIRDVAIAGHAVASLLKVLEAAEQRSIETALEKCADLARSEVLLRHSGRFQAPSPDETECRRMTTDARGRKVAWAVLLGDEMHEEARQCAERYLSALRPGGYSLEQRYRYDKQTGRKKLVSPEEERLLEETGNGGELKGSLKPDVVIHSGDPLDVQAVYDFKFPCMNTGQVAPWSVYSEGSPFAGQNQGFVYQKILGQNPARIMPRLGVIR